MAKKKAQRERPTLKTLRELRATIDDLQRQASRSTALLTDIQAVDAKVLERQIKQADAIAEARGLLHSIMDELGKDYATPLANKISRFLGRGEARLKSSVQRLLEQHAAVSDTAVN